MLTLAYLFVVVAGAWLLFLGLDARFHLVHRYKRRKNKAFWRERNRRERRSADLTRGSDARDA